MIPALILTAGLGTRLRPLSYVRAKGALPLAGEPLARRILRWLNASGVRDAVLNLHHLPHTLTRVIGDGSEMGMRVRYSWETPVLGSAGGPRRALPLLTGTPDPSAGSGSPRATSRGEGAPYDHTPEGAPYDGARNEARDSFLIVNGDTLTNVDLDALVAHHDSDDALVTMAVIPNTQPDKYSGVASDADGRFMGFIPKGSSERSFHFVGVQVAEPEAFSSISPYEPFEVRTLYLALAAARPGSVRLFRTDAEFLDIGTPADYLSTALLLAERDRVPAHGARTRIAAAARVERSVLWDDVVVEEGAMLNECVVADGVVVPADTSWHGVTLRLPTGELAVGERLIDGLAVCPIDGTPEGAPYVRNHGR